MKPSLREAASSLLVIGVVAVCVWKIDTLKHQVAENTRIIDLQTEILARGVGIQAHDGQRLDALEAKAAEWPSDYSDTVGTSTLNIISGYPPTPDDVATPIEQRPSSRIWTSPPMPAESLPGETP